MALPPPKFILARGVFELPVPAARTPDQDDRFIQAVREEFPNIAARQMLPMGLPSSLPYLALQSTASRLAISAVSSELETRFYGEYEEDAERCIEYLRRKLNATLRGWAAVGVTPSFVGLVMTMHFSFTEDDPSPAQFILEHHFRQEVHADALQDATAKVAVRADDTHFVTLTISNYEMRTHQRPVFSGQQLLQVRPWEGTVDDRGIELVIDVNNKLALINREGDIAVDDAALQGTFDLMIRAIATVPDDFVDAASLDVASLSPQEAND
jgi:hypothetical protein